MIITKDTVYIIAPRSELGPKLRQRLEAFNALGFRIFF